MPPLTKSDSLRTSFALAMMLGSTVLSAQQLAEPTGAKGQWEVLENCRLVKEAFIDGDSFHIRHGNREYIVRLYFVDSPETDPSLKDRAIDQAAYFDISPSEITRAGGLATEFAREKLSDHKFTVVTRWQNAQGRSSLARFYGVVLVQGRNLADELIANGLARIYGLRANWPEGTRSTTIVNRLKNLELQARQEGRGIWNTNAFPRAGTQDDTSKAAAGIAESETADDARLDVNTATYDELRELPGIGPVLAERIIAHRPFGSVEEMDNVKGIGPKTLERLQGLVRVTVTSPGND